VVIFSSFWLERKRKHPKGYSRKPFPKTPQGFPLSKIPRYCAKEVHALFRFGNLCDFLDTVYHGRQDFLGDIRGGKASAPEKSFIPKLLENSSKKMAREKGET